MSIHGGKRFRLTIDPTVECGRTLVVVTSAANYKSNKGGLVVQPKKVKSKAAKKTPAHVLQSLAKTKLDEFVEESKQRGNRAEAFYKEQDEDTQESIDRMTDCLANIMPRRMAVSVNRAGERVIVDISEEITLANAGYLAVEILKDLGQIDIRVANFKFPALCVECATPITRKKVA